MTSLLSLDDEEALDPATVGVKAANLARARRSGLPVLPGVVVPIDAGRAAIELGLETLRRAGPGKARLAVDRMSTPEDLAGLLSAAGAALGDNLILRSSTTLDDDDRFSGAFGSIADVRPDEVAGAVRGCWSSFFSADALGRMEATGTAPDGIGVATLIQRMLDPELGGWAELQRDSSASVAAVSGHPGPLFGGAARGARGVLTSGGAIPHELSAIGLSNQLVTVLIASVQSAQLVGCRRIEWAVECGQLWVLQLDPGQAGSPNVSPDDSQNSTAGTLIACGTPASPGRATGRVLRLRSIHEPLDDVDGRILVVDEALATYAPLLYRAAGLIAIEGSPAAHLCTVARSLHVPAVVGVQSPDADDIAALRNMNLCVVDGDLGTVGIAEPGAGAASSKS